MFKLLLRLLNYGFCKKSLLKDATLKSWTQKGTCSTYSRYLFAVKKVFNFSELHLSEVTSYKIHILTKHQTNWIILVKLLWSSQKTSLGKQKFISYYYKGNCRYYTRNRNDWIWSIQKYSDVSLKNICVCYFYLVTE